MKKWVITLMFMFAFATLVFADGHNNDLDNQQMQGQIGINKQQQGQIGINEQQQGIINSGNSDNKNVNKNVNKNHNKNINSQGQGQDQGQMQGQSMGQAMGQGQVAVGKVGVEVQDNSSYKSYAFSPPGLSANKGVNEGNIYSVFGGIGLASTEEYAICVEKISVIERLEKLGYITAIEARVEARKVFLQLKEASKAKRFLGVLGKTRGRNLINLFGLLSWDSLWDDDAGIGEIIVLEENRDIN